MAVVFHSDDTGKLILRLAVGGLLLFHGIYKISSGVDWMVPMLSSHAMPGLLRYGVYIGEVVAPLLIIVGLLTRPAGLVVAFNMTMAIYLALNDKVTSLKEQGGGWAIELEMLFLLGGLAIFFFGAGKFSASRGKGTWN